MLTKLRSIWQSAGWGRYWICLPLWLTLWNAPLPWLHQHAVAEEHVDHVLERHLRTFDHTSYPPHDSQNWHWHLALLWQMMDGGQCPGDEPAPSPHLLIENHCPWLSAVPNLPNLPAEQRFFSETLPAGRSHHSLTPKCVSRIPDHSPHFLQTFHAGSFRDLLSVARC